MAQVIWTVQATEDVERIAEYVAQESEQYASLLVSKLYARVQSLRQFPMMGRMVPEKEDPSVRELIEGNYRIIYEVLSDDLILIETVRHSAQNFRY
jgi:addiction module RelE/StbE family toxin